MEDNEQPEFHRKIAEFEDFQKFKLSSKTFERQYSNIYIARLKALMTDMVQKAKAKWVGCKIITLSNEFQEFDNERYIIIGILYKHEELKSLVVQELSRELQLTPQPSGSNYGCCKDTLFLEDEMLRVKLVGQHPNIQEVVTGLVCAVFGYMCENGTFWVEDWCFPGHIKNPCIKQLSSNDGSQKQESILIISGLDFTNNAQSVSLNLLSEWIIGMAGYTEAQSSEASIVRVIISGNSVRGCIEMYKHKGYSESKAHNQMTSVETAMAVHRLDTFLHSIVQCCCVTLMPGEFDPVCYTIPQQPFHPCILPQSARYKSLHGATNPWIGKIGCRIVAGSSGQPIADIMKIANLKEVSPLTWLERTLEWRHFAPTAPSTLPAYPFYKSDPFIMTQCPDIYFTGNMEQYDTKLLTNEGQIVRLICIPKFSKSQTAVLINLSDLNTLPISFGTG